MKILVIGSGGREHTFAWKLAQSPKVTQVFVAPGNAGTALENKTKNIAIDATDIPSLIEFAKKEAINLTIVGPEAPLTAGIVNEFTAAGLRCFGPDKGAAQLEGSKRFSKEFMDRYAIPTARYACFTDAEEAKTYVQEQSFPVVIKADGLAAGKGVVIAYSLEEALEAIDDMLLAHRFGQAGNQIVIEEFLQGEEVSFIVISDGNTVLTLATSQDHKARDAHDKGPNTGGMGAYSPAGLVNDNFAQRIKQEIIEPTINGMAAEGHIYKGFLYAGLMITPQGEPKVLEFNCRCGDPETQPILMRLQSDFYDLCDAAYEQQLEHYQIQWDSRCALGVVLTAGGYPYEYRKGDVISGLQTETTQDVKIFHAGTRLEGDNIMTHGGRVLCVTALADDIQSARDKAYAAAENIRWNDVYYRADIGYRAIARNTEKS